MSENARFGRQPVQVVEIDQDFCGRTYSAESPQTAYGLVGTRPLLLETGYFGLIPSTAEVSKVGDEAGFLICDDAKPRNLSAEVTDQVAVTNFISEIAATAEATIDFWFSPEEQRPSGPDESVSPILQIGTSEGDSYYLEVSYGQKRSTGSGLVDNSLLIYFRKPSGASFTPVVLAGVTPTNGMPPKAEVVNGAYKRITVTVSGGGPGTGAGAQVQVFYNSALIFSQTSTNESRYLGAWGQGSAPSGHLKIGGVRVPYVSPPDRMTFSRLRVYKSALSASQVSASGDGNPVNAAGLLLNVAEDTSYTESRGCNAAAATNLIQFSEALNSAGWVYLNETIKAPYVGVGGLSMNRFSPADGATSGSVQTELSGFRVQDAEGVEFQAVFESGGPSGVLTVGLSVLVQVSNSVSERRVELDLNPESGNLIADNSSTGDFNYTFAVTPLPGGFKVSLVLLPTATDEQDSTEATATVGISGVTDEYIVAFGGATVTLQPGDQYTQTRGKRKIKTGTQPCFNTRSTCQDPANYDKGVQVLRFVEKRSPIPTDNYYRPSVKPGSVRVTPARLNPGGADRNARALGQRASLTVSFQDHPDNDRLVDPYRAQRDYPPLERGTFWTKWRARNPYYMQRPLRLRSGYLKDSAIVDAITREFVITGFSGPDNQGTVTISGKDVLTLAEDEKAQAPVASRGKLAGAITSGATSATLTPAGIGNSEYPPSGFVRVGKEVMNFTRSGDSLTLVRGQFGTEVKAHDEDDTVQLCLRYVSQKPQDILYDLLANYANIPPAYLDKAQWDAEALDFLPRLYTAIITEPNGVSKLISEMCQQMYFTIWWDERLGKVILKSVRPAQEDEVFELDDDKHLIANSVSWKDLSEELITQVWVYYGQLNPTEKLDQGSNFATIAITADPDAEGPDKHNLRRIKTIFSRWIDATNASAAEDLGQRILNRYGNAPRQVTFKVDAKDSYLWLGQYIRLTNRLRVDQFGKVTPVNLQIFQAEESQLGSEYQMTAQEFIPALIGGDQVEDPDERVIPITSDLLNVNLRTLHDSLFGAPTGTEKVTFIIREGVTIGGDAAGGGVNVAAGARVSTNDFYDAGNSSQRGQPVGQVPILQRSGIGAPRNIGAGATYTYRDAVTTAADYLIKEYPVSVALSTGTWPAGVSLSLIVEAGGGCLGEGGNGSAHLDLIPGGDGGDALTVTHPLAITNGGVIGGAGGGGSMSGTAETLPDGAISADGVFVVVPGGGGQGSKPAQTRGVSFYDPDAWASSVVNADPAAGSALSAGAGGASRFRLRPANLSNVGEPRDYRSGSGGALGAAGGSASVNGFVLTSARYAGLPGKAVRAGANLITWVNKGDVRGDEVS